MTAPHTQCQPEADELRRINGEFYAKGSRVFRAPIETKTEGGTSINVGFPVCTVSEYVDVEAVASCLNASREIATLQARVEEAEKIIREVVRSYPVAAGTSKYGYEEDHNGYGSIRECRLYLERHSPSVPLERSGGAT